MKTLTNLLTLTLLLTFFSCNGGGESGSAGGTFIDENGNTVTLLQYDSFGAYGTYNYYGQIVERSLSAPIYKDEVVIPSQIRVTYDQNSSLRVGDRAYIMLNNFFDNRCEYVYNGSVFAFNQCLDDVAGFQIGDTIVLSNYPHPSSGVNREVTLMLFGRLSTDKHTGIIRMETSL